MRILLAVRRLREERAQRHFERQLGEVQRRKNLVEEMVNVRGNVREKVAVLEEYFVDAAKSGASAETVSYCASWRSYLRQLGLYWDTKKIEAQYHLRRSEKILDQKRNEFRFAHAARERVEHLYRTLLAQEQANAEIATADQLDGIAPRNALNRLTQDHEEALV
ncbi:MAG: hypothetical protein ACRDAM_21255 [Casimicrobium sp.]